MRGKNLRVVLTGLSIAALVCTACPGLTDNITIPGTPSISGITPGNEQLTVNWAAVEGADSYDLYCGEGSAIPADPVQKDIIAATAAITALTNGTAYNVWVRAKNAAGAGNASEPKSGVPTGKPVISRITTGDSLLIVSWTAVSGAGSYEVYYGSTSETLTDTTAKETASASPLTITGLSNGTSYNVWLKVIGAPQVNEASDPKTGTPAAIKFEGSSSIESLLGTWTSIYDDSYTITGTMLSYDDGYGGKISGTIRYINNFNAASRVIIIEYTEEGKPTYNDYDENFNIIAGPFDPPGYFQGVYYKSLSAGSVQMGNATDASKSGHLAAPETATLDEAKNKFTQDAASTFMSFYGTYSKVAP
ncbi:MAG: fibronectin type III domain-containing protein [Treponema sp.]|nr:fibronectin type III domain-containing protein [Treponema sp.]